MIRLLLVAIFLLLFFILSIPLYLIEWILGKVRPNWADRSAQFIVKLALRIIGFLAGVHLTVKGKENLPENQSVLYIGNHRSFFDVVLTYPQLPGQVGFLGKIEFKKVPFINHWMTLLHCLFLDRADIRQGLKTILDAIELVKSGSSIMIYPEGTRSKSEKAAELLPFHEGSFKVATKTGCPIVPVSITHTSEVFEDHFPWIHSADVTLEFGTPLYPSQMSREELKGIGSKVREIIAQTITENE